MSACQNNTKLLLTLNSCINTKCPKNFGTLEAQKKNMQHFRKPLSPMLMLRIVGEFYANFDHFFLPPLLRVMPEMRHKLSQQRWNMVDETHHHHHHHFVWIRCPQPYLFLVKEKKEKKKDRRLCVLVVVVLGDDIPFRQQQ